MRIGKVSVDPIKLWGEYCDIQGDERGPFLSPTFCPNPDHPNSRSPAFQINISKPFVHCFAHCGISGTYEHAVCVIEGLYDKFKVSEKDILNAKKKWQLNEPLEVRQSRSKVRTAHNAARKIIFQRASAVGRIGSNDSKKSNVGSPSRNNKGSVNSGTSRPKKAKKKSEAEVVTEDTLADYSYLPKEAIQYLESRGINEASRHRWQIGFDENAQRVTIPVRDHRGKLLFIIRRGIHKWQSPAYLYPFESAKSLLLFGACNLDLAMVRSEGLIVVEGSIDTILQHQRGYQNTVGSLGNHLSEAQIRLIVNLRPKRIYAFGDKDAGGVALVQSFSPLQSKFQIKVPLYPKGNDLDPAKITDKQATEALRRAVPLGRMIRKINETKRKGEVVRVK